MTKYHIVEVLSKRISRKGANRLEVKMRVYKEGFEETIFTTTEIFTKAEWERVYENREYQR